MLSALEFGCTVQHQGDTTTIDVEVPSYRLDVSIPADLIEETRPDARLRRNPVDVHARCPAAAALPAAAAGHGADPRHSRRLRPERNHFVLTHQSRADQPAQSRSSQQPIPTTMYAWPTL